MVTSGDKIGTSGRPRADLRPWVYIAAIAVVFGAVNASSQFLDMRRAGLGVHWWEPLVWEATSVSIIVALAPLIGMAIRRWPIGPDAWFRPTLIHLGLTVPFAAAHIAGMWVLRELVYALGQARYGYFDDGFALVAFYEWRKDILTYALIAAIYWTFDALTARRPGPVPAPTDGRIEVRSGTAALFLSPVDITHVEAAGNYVELHTTAGKPHLVRGTLTAWETQLSARDFVRVHRSRLVNRAKVAAVKPTASGDMEITLVSGETVLGSRRFRAALQGRSPT